MTAAKISGMVGALLLCALVTTAWGEEFPIDRPCELPNPERPYVCDIGKPKPLSLRSFKEILRNDAALRAVVQHIGMPYAAEIQQVRVEDPWYSWELRTYYPEYDRMYAFSRAFILGVPEISLLRYEGPMPYDRLQIAALPGDAERAAERAERAAAEAEALADRAERDASRAEAIADQAGRDFHRTLLKH